MEKEFLIGLGLDEEKADELLTAIGGEIEAFRTEIARQGLSDKYARSVHGALSLAGAKNVTAAHSVLDFEWDGCDFDGEPTGLSDAVASLKAEMPYLFKSDEEGGECFSFIGISPVEEADVDIAPEELSYSEYMRLYRGR